jgi:hypothetical protein
MLDVNVAVASAIAAVMFSPLAQARKSVDEAGAVLASSCGGVLDDIRTRGRP